MDSATILPPLTNMSDYVLSLMAKARKIYTTLQVNFGLMVLPDTNFMLVMVDVIADSVPMSMWQPVVSGNSDDVVGELRRGRDDALASALEVLVAGAGVVAPPPSPMIISTPLTDERPTSIEVLDVSDVTCTECGAGITSYPTGSMTVSSDEVVRFTTGRWGAPYCVECSNARNKARIRGN